MKGKYKRAKAYCKCDKAIVAIGKKCPVCGRRNIKGKLPKLNLKEIRSEYKEEV